MKTIHLSHRSCRIAAGGLFLLAAILPAAQPLLSGALPWTADGLLHLHRLAQFDRALRHGMLYPRWMPDMGFGFGFPLFNYYAPLSYYLAETFRLAGLGAQNALLGAFGLALLAASVGAYLWGRDLFGEPAGFVAGLAYAYSPYLLVNVFHRGALAEVWGMVCLPFALWALRRLAVSQQRRYLALSAGCFAALILSHNVLAFVSAPLLAAYAVLLWVANRPTVQRGLLLAGALAAGLGLAAFFWAPAFFERDLVQIHQLYAPADLDYRNNFSSLGDIFSLPRPVDDRMISPDIPNSVGWGQLALAVLALASLRRIPPGEARRHVGLLALAALGMIGMTLPLSIGIWDRIPLLRFVQFPWRFLGPASLFLALLAGGGAARLVTHGRATIPLIAAGLALLSFTWLFPRFYPDPPEPTPLTLIAFEHETGALGTTSAADYLPIWVTRLPPAESLIAAYEAAGAGGVITRLDAGSLPPDARIVEARYGLTSADLLFDSPADFTALLNWFYFPGWHGRLDGQPVELRPLGEHGLLAVDVPAGQRHLSLRFGDTPLRRWATGISLLSLAALGLTCLLWRGAGPHEWSQQKVDLRPWAWAALVGLVLLAFKGLYLDRHDSIFRRSRFDGQQVIGVQEALSVDFGGQMALLGYDLALSPRPTSRDAHSVPADGVIELALYWRALQPLDTDYSVAVHLVDDLGRRYGQKDSQHPARYPTSRWEVDTYARDVHRLAIWPGTPPGEYALLVSVYDVTTGRALEVRDLTGAPADAIYLAAVRVIRPTRPLHHEALEVRLPMEVELGGGVGLLGLDPPPPSVDAGQALPLMLYWEALDAPNQRLAACLSLITAHDETVAETCAAPGRVDHPTRDWLAGEIVRDGRSLLVPAAVPSGAYTLAVRLVDERGESVGRPAELVRVTVRAPERHYDPPQVQHSAAVELEGQARLVGYELSSERLAPSDPFTVTLFWQVQATTDVAYSVFVHLLDDDERIWTQSDQTPGRDRPTTSWLPGEFIRDPHALTVPSDAPAGSYRLALGLYDPVTGRRLRITRGTEPGDRVLLPVRLVVDL